MLTIHPEAKKSPQNHTHTQKTGNKYWTPVTVFHSGRGYNSEVTLCVF